MKLSIVVSTTVAMAFLVSTPRLAGAGEALIAEDALVSAARRIEGAVVTLRTRGTRAWAPATSRSTPPARFAEPAPGTIAGEVADARRLVELVTARAQTMAHGEADVQGFFVGDGLVLTAASAVEGVTKLDVVAADGRHASAVVTARDRDFGIALLRTTLSGTPLELDASSELEAGRVVILPTLEGDGVQVAIVSSRGAAGGARGIARLPKHAQGMAGAPALGPDGRVRGILVAEEHAGASTYANLAWRAGAAERPHELLDMPATANPRLYFAASRWGTLPATTSVLPARRLARALPDLLRDGRVRKGYLGIVLGASPGKGEPLDDRRVARLLPGSPAEKTLQAGDRIVAVAGRRLQAFDDLTHEILSLVPGVPATLTVERAQQGGEPQTVQVEVTPTERAEEANARGAGVFGFEATPLTPELKSWLRVAEDGLVVSDVTKGSAAERAGLRRGDRLVRLVGRDVSTLGDLGAAADDALRRLAADEAVTLEVVRDGAPIALQLHAAVATNDLPTVPARAPVPVAPKAPKESGGR